MASLFRREAIDHQRDRFHGAIVLASTWSSTALTLFLCAAVASVILFAGLFGFARKEAVSGVLAPDRGLLRLSAPQAGVVADIHVSDGQAVHAGDPLFTISSAQTSATGATQSTINETLAERMTQLQADLQRQSISPPTGAPR
ncbi:MAG: biotin/lipoyl-binding protein [Pseudomonadota bacterium]